VPPRLNIFALAMPLGAGDIPRRSGPYAPPMGAAYSRELLAAERPQIACALRMTASQGALEAGSDEDLRERLAAVEHRAEKESVLRTR
jgi:hypothetical protein